MSTAAEQLWPFEKLPDWDPQLMLELFLIQRKFLIWKHDPSPAAHAPVAPTKKQLNDLAGQLMYLVALNFGRSKWVRTLDKGSGAADVANGIVMFIIDNAHRYHSKTPWEKLPSPDGYKVLIKALNTSVYRKVMEEFDRAKARRNMAMAESDSAEGMDMVPAPSPLADTEGLRRLLEDDEVMDRLVGSAACALAAPGQMLHGTDLDVLFDLCEQQRLRLLEDSNLVGPDGLTGKSKGNATYAQHSLIVFKLGALVRDFAASSDGIESFEE